MIEKLFTYLRKKFFLSPKDLLDDGEKIVLVVRRHPLYFAKEIGQLSVLYFFLPMIFFYLFLNKYIDLSFIYSPIVILLIFFWAVSGISYGFYLFLLWSQDSFIFTNLRIFDIDQKSIFNRTTSSIGWESVSDITFTSRSFLEVAFDMGLVKIITNAEKTNIEIFPVANPQNLANEILKMSEKFTKERSFIITDEELEKIAKREALLQNKIETHLESLRNKKKMDEESKLPEYLKEKK